MSQQRGKAGAFSTRIIVGLLIVGIFSFSAFITLSTFAPEMRRGDNGQAHALSRSAVGFAGMVELLRSMDVEVTVNRHPGGNEHAELVILTPPEKLTRDEITRLGGYTTLIVLPKWSTQMLYTHPGWVASSSTVEETRAVEPIIGLVPKATIKRALAPSRVTIELDGSETSGPITSLQTLSGDGLEPIVETAGGGILVARVSKDSTFYVLSDPDLLNTQGISDVNTARAGVALVNALRVDEGSVVFDVTLNGLETARNLLRVALTPPLLGATLALFAAGALLAWRVVMQSGPRVQQGRAIALGKKALAENSAALIRLAGREHTMGGRYAALLAAVAAEKIGAPRAESAETFAMLDRVGALQGMKTPYSVLAAEAANARTPADVVVASHQLMDWIEEMLRAAR